jgi:hypothetical protein
MRYRSNKLVEPSARWLVKRGMTSYVEANPSCFIAVNRAGIREEEHIKRIFICPGISNRCFENCLKFISLDACHCKTGYKSMIFMACGRDSQLVIYAWALVEAENNDSWEWFCRNLDEAMPAITNELGGE